MSNLRIVITIYDDSMSLANHYVPAVVTVTDAQQKLIANVSEIKNPAEWAAEELRSTLECLEAVYNG